MEGNSGSLLLSAEGSLLDMLRVLCSSFSSLMAHRNLEAVQFVDGAHQENWNHALLLGIKDLGLFLQVY